MGTANTQIARHQDVTNKRIHNGFSASYATTATKCVTKGNLQKIEFLEAKDRSTSNDIFYSANTAFGTGSSPATLSINNGSMNFISYSNIYYTTYQYDYTSLAYCAVYNSRAINAYTSINISSGCAWPDEGENYAEYAIFAKQITGVSRGLTELTYTLAVEALLGDGPTTQTGTDALSTYGVSNTSITYGIIITDSNGQIIARNYPTTEYAAVTDSILFTASTSSIYVYIIVPNLKFDFSAGVDAHYAGFKLKTTTKITYFQSSYDLDTKCVQYQDVNHPTGKTFTIYYGVWNNKGSNAKLNNLYVQIKKTTDSTWTTIGTAALPSSLNSTTTGSVTCTLPTSYNPAVQYDFRVTAGETNANQEWWYRWGSQSTLSNSGYSWTKYSGSAKTGVCTNPDGLNTQSAYSTLRNYNYPTTTLARGRSSAYAALFCIE